MQLIADESVDYGIIIKLRLIGFDVLSIADYSPGIDDKEVLQISFERNLLLITEDKDFGDLVYRLKMAHKGILLIRMNDISRIDRLKIVPVMIKDFFVDLENNFSVLTSNGLRVKKHRT
jgi:predicted nuclease of predicted toxin-antitoxin system